MGTLEIIAGCFALVAAHEAGHATAAQAFGLRWRLFARLPWKVGVAVYDATPGQSRIVALAGPAVNLLAAAALLATGTPWSTVGWISLLMATGPSYVDWLEIARTLRRDPFLT